MKCLDHIHNAESREKRENKETRGSEAENYLGDQMVGSGWLHCSTSLSFCLWLFLISFSSSIRAHFSICWLLFAFSQFPILSISLSLCFTNDTSKFTITITITLHINECLANAHQSSHSELQQILAGTWFQVQYLSTMCSVTIVAV